MKLRGIKMYFKLFQIGGSIIAWPNVCRERRLFSPRRRSSPSRPPVHRSRWRFSRPPPPVVRSNTSTLVCEGNGQCVCGECDCFPIGPDSGAANAQRYSGAYCQCNDYSCDYFDNQLCGGALSRDESERPSVRIEGGGFFGLPVVGFRVGAIWKKIHTKNSTRPWGGGGRGGSSSVYQLLIFM